MYEPKNRTRNDLGVLDIAVEHRDGTIVGNPNSMIISAARVLIDKDIKAVEGFEVFDLMSLKPVPDQRSIISGEPAIVYKTDEMTIPMTVEELIRFLGHALFSEEYLKLREHYGLFHEIHEDFYDPETTEPLQSLVGDEL